MRVKMFLPAALSVLLLAACGHSRNDDAAEACNAAIATKLADKNVTLDRKDMARSAKDEAANVVVIASTAVFDKGLSTEYRQTFDCRVRFETGKAPSVIGMQFNWNKDDLKKVDEGG